MNAAMPQPIAHAELLTALASSAPPLVIDVREPGTPRGRGERHTWNPDADGAGPR